MEIGNKLKELRLKNDLTLEELANRSELTKGFLSQVERDLTSPSISTLSDILEALGVEFSEFFVEEKKVTEVFSEDDFFVNVRDDYTISWIIPNAQKNNMEPILIEIMPNKSSMNIEPFSGEEFGFVLSGNVDLVFDNQVYNLESGQTFYLLGDKSHYLHNKSNEIAKILWITNPPVF